jgi:hypothetical protein
MKSFASPKTRTTPDPEALQRLMAKTEVDGGGGLNAEPKSEVVAKPSTAIHAPANEMESEPDPAPSIDEIPPPPVPTLPTGRSRGRGTKEERPTKLTVLQNGAVSKRFAELIRIIRNHPVTGGFERGELAVDDGA